MPEGETWHPGIRVTMVELSPILTWRKGDPWWEWNNAVPHIIAKKESEILNPGAHRPNNAPSISIFIAFRMGNNVSVDFRKELEDEIHAHPALREVQVVDGRTPAGTRWDVEIR